MGYIGSTLVPYLINKYSNYEITIVDNLLYGNFSLGHLFLGNNLKFFNLDISDEKSVESFFKTHDFDIIIHLASIVGYPACKMRPDLANKVNVNGSLNISKFSSDKTKIIFSSTGSNYGGQLTGVVCDEDSPINPLSIYAENKVNAEKIFLERKNVVILRFATAFGVSLRMRLDLLINDFVYQAVNRKNLTVYEKNFQRTFIHVKDIAKSFDFTIQNFDKMANEIFNIGSEEMNFSKEHICELIKRYCDFYLHYADFAKDEDQRNYIVSFKKVKKIGFECSIKIDDAIKELILFSQNVQKRYYFSNI